MSDVKGSLVGGGFQIAKEVSESTNDWFSGPAVIVPYLPEINGLVSVDVVNQPWPDAMGSPKDDPITFAAWGMGHFGPFTFPGGLTRARQQSWAWQEGALISQSHLGFIRVRSSYVFGCPKDALCLPVNYDPTREILFLTRLTKALFEIKTVIGYFNPNGEVLECHSGFTDLWKQCIEQNLVPLPLWSNIRLYNLNSEFGFMDTVGNSQLDIRDVEAIFPRAKYSQRDVGRYLRNVSLYLLQVGRDLCSGESIDGPVEDNLSWVIESLEEGLVQPPRRVFRLIPRSNSDRIHEAIGTYKASKT
jgi:hypothetical protein